MTIGRPVAKSDYGPEGDRQAALLRSRGADRFTFDRAFLRDVLRFLGEEAGIPFISIPESAPQAQQLVTFTMTASPFTALESIAKQYGIRLVYEGGVWFLRVGSGAGSQNIDAREAENELIGVIYQLRHDPAERVDFRQDLIGQQNASGGSGVSAFGGGGGFGGGGSMAPSSPNLPLQNSQKVFALRAPKLVNDVRAILGLKPLKYNEDGTIEDPDITPGTDIPSQSLAEAQQATKGSAPPKDRDLLPGEEGGAALRLSESRQKLGLSPVYVPAARPQVIYNSETNFLWVVATRKQHKWVAEYLSKVDAPQDLIAIEVKFLETKKNPQYDLGINWGNMLGTGITVRGSANAGIGGEYGFGFERRKDWGGTNTTSSGFDNNTVSQSSILGAISNAIVSNQTNLTIVDILNNSAVNALSRSLGATNSTYSSANSSTGDSTSNFDVRGQTTAIPYEAVLSMDEVSVTLQAFMEDRDSSIVQYPRVLTLNNKEVAITSAENTPLNIGTDTAVSSTGTSGQTVGQLGYLPTGTQINILPKVVNNNQIAMTVAITVSSIVQFVPINLGTGSNLYPITSERVYNATLQVDSGYTLAVGGLEKVDDRDVQGGVPFLKDVPGLGYFFRNKNKKRDRVNLIIFITPYLIGDPARTPGISETPRSVVPLRPGVPADPPTFTPDGRLSGGDAALPDAFAWLDFQLRYFRQINSEGMISRDSVQKLREVISVARLLLSDRQLSAGPPPYDPATVQGRDAIRAEELLADLNRVLAATQENLM